MIKVERVEITRRHENGEEPEIVVTPYWTGVDRPQGSGYAMPATKGGEKLAQRLKAAMLSMAMYPSVEAKTDINGKTFASHGYTVRGRCMNADLRALGY